MSVNKETLQWKKKAFRGQRDQAKCRKIDFLLTFEEWINIWEQSGHWNKRGCNLGEYCMSRYNDIGPYSIDNVFIQLHADNIREAKPNYSPNGGRILSEEWKRNIGNSCKGRKHTPETKEKMSKSAKVRPAVTDETKKKLSDAAKKRIVSDETKKKMSESKRKRDLRNVI